MSPAAASLSSAFMNSLLPSLFEYILECRRDIIGGCLHLFIFEVSCDGRATKKGDVKDDDGGEKEDA